MALNDFAPYNSSMGGHMRIHWARLADTAVRKGEAIYLDASGNMDAIADNGATVAGVALGPLAVSSTVRGYENPDTGLSYAAGDLMSYVAATSEQLFITNNFTDASGVAVTPLRTHIGDLCSIDVTATVMSLAAGVGTNFCAIVVDVLDSAGNSLQKTGTTTTGVDVVFKFGPFAAGVIVQWQGGM